MLNGGCYEVKKHCQRQKYDCPTTFLRNEKDNILGNQLYGYYTDLVISRHMVRYILTRVISVKSSKNLEKTQVTMVTVPSRLALSMGHGMLNTFVFVYITQMALFPK